VEKLPESEFIFPHAKGERAGEAFRNLRRSFQSALRAAGISNFRWHDMRHSFGSHLAMGGADLVSIQRLLGHKSLRMTSRYAHVSDVHLKRQVELLDNIFTKPSPSAAMEIGTPQQKEARQGRRKQKPQGAKDAPAQ
jgi:integrase